LRGHDYENIESILLHLVTPGMRNYRGRDIMLFTHKRFQTLP
jgi:hypothetical protein